MTKTELKEAIKEKQKDIDTMHRIMSNCYSDEAYRDYSRTLSRFIGEKIALDKQLEKMK